MDDKKLQALFLQLHSKGIEGIPDKTPQGYGEFRKLMHDRENVGIIYDALKETGEKMPDVYGFYHEFIPKDIQEIHAKGSAQQPAPVAQAEAPALKEEPLTVDEQPPLTPDDLMGRATDPRVTDYAGREERMSDLEARTPSTQQPKVVTNERGLVDQAFTTPNSPLYPIGKVLGIEPDKTTHQEFTPEEKGATLYDINNGYKPIKVSNDQLHAYLNNEAEDLFGKPLDQLSPKEHDKVVGKMADRYITPDVYNKLAQSENFQRGMSQGLGAYKQGLNKFTESLYDLSLEGLHGLVRPFFMPTDGAFSVKDPVLEAGHDKGNLERLGKSVDESFKSAQDYIHKTLPQDPEAEQSFLMSKLPSGVGSTVPFMIPGGGGMMLGAFAEAENLYEDAKAKGATDKDAMRAFVQGLPIGATEALPVANGLERLAEIYGAAKVKEAFSRVLAQGAENALIQALEEGGQEGMQTTLENIVAKDIVGYDPERERSKGVTESAAIGGATGGLMGAVGGFGAANIPTELRDLFKNLSPAEKQRMVEELMNQADNNPVQTENQPVNEQGDNGVAETQGQPINPSEPIAADVVPVTEETATENTPAPVNGRGFAVSRPDLLPEELNFAYHEATDSEGNQVQHNSQMSGYHEVGGIGIAQYSNPETGDLDVVMSGTSDNDFVGFMRIYDADGNPTNRWTSRFENKSGDKGAFKTMMSEAQALLPEGHEYTEATSISTDGLRVWDQQLRHGYEMQRDENGNLVTTRVKVNEGSEEDADSDRLMAVSQGEGFKGAKKKLLPYLKKLGLTADNIYHDPETGVVSVDLPVLRSTRQAAPETQAQGQPVAQQPAAPVTPEEGKSTVQLPPSFPGGQPRTMVFKDGEWKINVGGDFARISEATQQQAQAAFEAENAEQGQPEAQPQTNEQSTEQQQNVSPDESVAEAVLPDLQTPTAENGMDPANTGTLGDATGADSNPNAEPVAEQPSTTETPTSSIAQNDVNTTANTLIGKDISSIEPLVPPNIIENKGELVDKREKEISAIRKRIQKEYDNGERYRQLVVELGDERKALEAVTKEESEKIKAEIAQLPPIPKSDYELMNEKGINDFYQIVNDLGFEQSGERWGNTAMDEEKGFILRNNNNDASIYILPHETQEEDEDGMNTIINGITIELLETTPSARGKGKAKELLNRVVRWADQNHSNLFLTLAPQDTSTTESGLKKLYEGVGFVFDGKEGSRISSNRLTVAEAYHKAKKEGNNTPLVSAVESLISTPTPEQPTPATRNEVKTTSRGTKLLKRGKGTVQTQQESPEAQQERKIGNIARIAEWVSRAGKGKVKVVYDQSRFNAMWTATQAANPEYANEKPPKAFVRVRDGRAEIYLNPDSVTADSPVHELAHPFVNALRASGDALYKQGIKLIAGTEYHRAAVRNGYTGAQALEEALVQLIGEIGAGRIEAATRNTPEIMDKLTQWVNKFWNWVKNTIPGLKNSDTDISNMTLQQVAEAIAGNVVAGRGNIADANAQEQLQRKEMSHIELEIADYLDPLADPASQEEVIDVYGKLWKKMTKGEKKDILLDISNALVEDGFADDVDSAYKQVKAYAQEIKLLPTPKPRAPKVSQTEGNQSQEKGEGKQNAKTESGDKSSSKAKQPDLKKYQGFHRMIVKHLSNAANVLQQVVKDNPRMLADKSRGHALAIQEALEEINDMYGQVVMEMAKKDGLEISENSKELQAYIEEINNSKSRRDAVMREAYHRIGEEFVGTATNPTTLPQRVIYLFGKGNPDTQSMKIQMTIEGMSRLADNAPLNGMEAEAGLFEALVAALSDQNTMSGQMTSISGRWAMLSATTAEKLLDQYNTHLNDKIHSAEQIVMTRWLANMKKEASKTHFSDQKAFSEELETLMEENEKLKQANDELANQLMNQANARAQAATTPAAKPKKSKTDALREKSKELKAKTDDRAKAWFKDRGNRLSANPFLADKEFLSIVKDYVKAYTLLAQANITDLIVQNLEDLGITLTKQERADVAEVVDKVTEQVKNEDREAGIAQIKKAMVEGVGEGKVKKERTPFQIYVSSLMSRAYEIAQQRNPALANKPATAANMKSALDKMQTILDEYVKDDLLWQDAANEAKEIIKSRSDLSEAQRQEMIDNLSEWLETNGLPPFPDSMIRQSLRTQIDGIMSDPSLDPKAKKAKVLKLTTATLKELVGNSEQVRDAKWKDMREAITSTFNIPAGSPVMVALEKALNDEFNKQVKAKRKEMIEKALPTEIQAKDKITAAKQKKANAQIKALQENKGGLYDMIGDSRLTIGAEADQLDQLFQNFISKYKLSVLTNADLEVFRQRSEALDNVPDGILKDRAVKQMMGDAAAKLFPTFSQAIRQAADLGLPLYDKIWYATKAEMKRFAVPYYSFWYPMMLSGMSTQEANFVTGIKEIVKQLSFNAVANITGAVMNASLAKIDGKKYPDAMRESRRMYAYARANFSMAKFQNAAASAANVLRNGTPTHFQDFKDINDYAKASWLHVRQLDRKGWLGMPGTAVKKSLMLVGLTMAATDTFFNNYYFQVKTAQNAIMRETSEDVMLTDMAKLDKAIAAASKQGSFVIDPYDTAFRDLKTKDGVKFGDIMDKAETDGHFGLFKPGKVKAISEYTRAKNQFAQDLYYNLMNENYQGQAAAKIYSDFYTYRGTPGGLLGGVAGVLNNMISKFPLVRHMIPFVNVTFNVFNVMISRTPYGMFRDLVMQGGAYQGIVEKATGKDVKSASVVGQLAQRQTLLANALFHEKLLLGEAEASLSLIPETETNRVKAYKKIIENHETTIARMTKELESAAFTIRQQKMGVAVGMAFFALTAGLAALNTSLVMAMRPGDDDDKKLFIKLFGLDLFALAPNGLISRAERDKGAIVKANTMDVKFSRSIIPKWSADKGFYLDDKLSFGGRTDSDDLNYLALTEMYSQAEVAKSAGKEYSVFEAFQRMMTGYMVNTLSLLTDQSGVYNTSDLITKITDDIKEKKTIQLSTVKPLVFSLPPKPNFFPQLYKSLDHGNRYFQDPSHKSILGDYAMYLTGNPAWANAMGGTFAPAYSQITGQQMTMLPGDIQQATTISGGISEMAKLVGGEPAQDYIDLTSNETLKKVNHVYGVAEAFPNRNYSPAALTRIGDKEAIVPFTEWNSMIKEADGAAFKQLESAVEKKMIYLPLSQKNKDLFGLKERDLPEKLNKSFTIKFEKVNAKGDKTEYKKTYLYGSIDDIATAYEKGYIAREDIKEDKDVATRPAKSAVMRMFIKELYGNEWEKVQNAHKISHR